MISTGRTVSRCKGGSCLNRSRGRPARTSMRCNAVGGIRREVLTGQERTKLNIESDTRFYDQPRFVTHVDDHFIAQVTQLYRERIPEDARVLDLMSSWVSHLPRDRRYSEVVGHGMNARELQSNDQLDDFFLTDLNRDPTGWPLKDASIDAVTCCVSVQYLQQPEKVFSEIARVLKPGGVCIMSFSNRMFPDKAIAAWRNTNDRGHLSLVQSYFQAVEGFSEPESLTEVKLRKGELVPKNPLAKVSWVIGRLLSGGYEDPFFAVVAYKEP